MADYDSIDQQRRWLHDLWNEFVNERKDKYLPLIHRRAPQHALPRLPGQAEVEVDIESPDLEVALNQFIDIILRNQTKLDLISQDTAKRAKDDVEDVRIASAISWAHQNDGDELRRYLVRCAQTYGVAAVCKLWQIPEEPESWPDQDDAENLADYAERAMKHRENHFREWFDRNQMFSWRPVSMLNLKFWPLDKPQVFIEEQVLQYIDARRLKRNDGSYLRLTQDKNVIFASQGESVDEPTDPSGMPTLTFIRHAMYNETKGRWVCTEYVCSSSGSESEHSYEVLDEYEVPFDHSPYFVLPSGGEDTGATDPHWRYRPQHMYPLIVLTQEENYLTTLLAERVVRRIINPYYVSVAGTNEDALKPYIDSGLFEVVEGAGGQRRLVFTVPDPSTGEVPVVPRFEAYPDDDITTLITRLDMVRQDKLQHSPNRLLTGSALDVATQGTGTSLINQTSNAQETFGRDADMLNGFVEDWIKAEHETIAYMSDDPELPKPVIYRTNGDEPLVREPRGAGEVIEITAEKLDHPFDIIVSTSLETLQDEIQRKQMADDARNKGAITKEQWLKRRGDTDDPRHQMVELERDQAREQYEPLFAQRRLQAIDRLMMAFGGLLLPDVQPQAAGGATPPPPAPTGQPESASVPGGGRPIITPTPMGTTTAGSAPPGPGGLG